MKKNLILFFAITSLLNSNAQTSKHTINFSIGGGFQQYKGDLGNGFTEIKDACWYGSLNSNLVVKLNKSFDAGVFFSKGDYSYCQTEEMKNKAVAEELKCVGCKDDRLGMGNLSSRIASGGFLLRYKFANDYILKESSLFKPYIFAGIASTNIVDRMGRDCVTPGKYISYTTGFGITYNMTKRFNLSYNFTLGCFNSDKVDKLSVGRGTDLFMQNSFMLGFQIF